MNESAANQRRINSDIFNELNGAAEYQKMYNNIDSSDERDQDVTDKTEENERHRVRKAFDKALPQRSLELASCLRIVQHASHSVHQNEGKFDVKGFLMMGLMMTALIVIVFILFTDDLVPEAEVIDRFGRQLNNRHF